MTEPEFDPANMPSDHALLETINAKLDWLRWHLRRIDEIRRFKADITSNAPHAFAAAVSTEPPWPGDPPLQPLSDATAPKNPTP